MDLIFQFSPQNTNRNSALHVPAIKDIHLTLIIFLEINQTENILSVKSKSKIAYVHKAVQIKPRVLHYLYADH